jgi:hypothetical protein
MCIYGLMTGHRESKVSFARRAGRINGRVTDVRLPEPATPVPLPFPLALDHNSY